MENMEEEKKARLKAMSLLERMDRTEKELRGKLSRQGFSGEAVEKAVDYVKSFGYLDDFRYARNYISSRMDSRGRQRILQELYQRGVDLQTAREAWEEEAALCEEDEEETVSRLIRKKYPEEISLDEKEMRRLYGFLSRRGFAPGVIFRALEKLGMEKKCMD